MPALWGKQGHASHYYSHSKVSHKQLGLVLKFEMKNKIEAESNKSLPTMTLQLRTSLYTTKQHHTRTQQHRTSLSNVVQEKSSFFISHVFLKKTNITFLIDLAKF
jgi:hypothetical protein